MHFAEPLHSEILRRGRGSQQASKDPNSASSTLVGVTSGRAATFPVRGYHTALFLRQRIMQAVLACQDATMANNFS